MMRIILAGALVLILGRLTFWWVEQKLLYFPSKNLAFTPSDAGITFTNHKFAAKYETIHAWHADAGSDVTILYCHGNAGNIGDRIDKLYRFYLSGFNVFMFDYQGYGQSTGTPSEEGIYASGLAAYDYLIATGLLKRHDTLIVYGTSLGGSVAAHIAANRKVHGIVLENAFVSLRSIAATHYAFIPGFLIPNRFRTLDDLKKTRIPKLIFHAKDDQIVPFSHGLRFQEDTLGDSRFVQTFGGHNESYIHSFDAWKEELLKFSEKLKYRKGAE